MFLRLAEVFYAPFYALFIVGPPALLFEMWWKSRRAAGLSDMEQVEPITPLEAR